LQCFKGENSRLVIIVLISDHMGKGRRREGGGMVAGSSKISVIY